jgi:hypothetical protein
VLGRTAVVERDEAALEAPVEHRAELAIDRHQLQQLIGNHARTTRIVARTEIEFRQHTFEQARHFAGDGVRIPQ